MFLAAVQCLWAELVPHSSDRFDQLAVLHAGIPRLETAERARVTGDELQCHSGPLRGDRKGSASGSSELRSQN